MNCIPLKAIIHSSDLTTSGWQKNENQNYLSLAQNHSFISFYKFAYPYPLINFNKDEINIGLYYDKTEPSCIFNIEKNKLSILPDINGALPLYYYQIDKTIYLCSDFIGLLELIPQNLLPGIDISKIVNYLLVTEDPSETVLANVYLLFPNKILQLNNETMLFKENSYILDSVYQTNYIDNLINNSIDKVSRFIGNHNNIGSTLSGGKDSAIISHKLINHLNFKELNLFSILLPNPDQKFQLYQINNFIKNIGGKINFANSSSMLSFSRIPQYSFQKFYNPYLDLYFEPTEYLANIAQKQNIKVMFTGFGGDELDLALNIETNNSTSYKKVKLPLFFNDNLVDIYRNTFSKNGVKKTNYIIPESTISSFRYYNTIWQNQGIWPIAPLANYKLFDFTKKTKTSYIPQYLMNNLPESFMDKKLKTNFGHLYEISLKLFLKNKFYLLETSVLSKLNLINYDILLKSVKNGQIFENYSTKYLSQIIILELFLSNYLKIKYEQ